MTFDRTDFEKFISQEIKDHGAIPGEKFMAWALQHPQWGYYQRICETIGRKGDFFTAPEMTSIFGELLCLQWIEVWQFMGSPAVFHLLELGPGTGRLAVDILRTARRFPKFYQALRYLLVESSRVLQQAQAHILHSEGFMEKCAWFDHLEQVAGLEIEGVVFGNEFLDALPVRWLEMTQSGLMEVGVTRKPEGGLTTTLMALQPGIHPDYFSRLGLTLPEGMQTEVGLVAQEWMERIGRVLKRGVLLFIDYGYTARDYYQPTRMSGTLVGHWRHQRVDDPLSHPGEMDLSAHVDFTAMAHAGLRAGMQPCGYTTQGCFFLGLGLMERLQMAMHQEGKVLGAALRESALRLILPEAMGERFKALAMTMDLGHVELSGYRLKNQWGEL